jgi:hypothetical protein
MRVLLSAVLAATLLGSASCTRHGEDGTFFIAGGWTGTVRDSRCGTGEISFIFIQTGDRITGSWRIVFTGNLDPACQDASAPDHGFSGPISGGTLHGTEVQITLQRPQGSSGCTFMQPITVIGTWTGDSFTARYSGFSCSGSIDGTISAQR